MAIKLAPTTFLAKGEFSVPGEDGNPLAFPFAARFKRLGKKEREAMDKRLNKRVFEAVAEGSRTPFMVEQLKSLKNVKPMGTDADFLDLMLVGWEFNDADGNPIEFNKANVAEVFEALDGLEAAFVRAYFDTVRKQPDIAKN